MVLRAFKKVFHKPAYVAIGTMTSLTAFVFAVWLPNIGLVVDVLFSSGSLSERFGLPLSLLGSISTNFSIISEFYIIATAVLFGMNLAMIIYFFKRRSVGFSRVGATTGLAGTASGALGIGCVACGSGPILITAILVSVGAGTLTQFLPFKGQEFSVAGIIFLTASIYLTARQIESPAVCKF
mgnify:FL=1